VENQGREKRRGKKRGGGRAKTLNPRCKKSLGIKKSAFKAGGRNPLKRENMGKKEGTTQKTSQVGGKRGWEGLLRKALSPG